MAFDGTEWVPEVNTLPGRFDPRRGPFTALLAIITSGIGAIFVAPFIGIAGSITGVVIAIQNILGGLRTFTVAFIEAFFEPFLVAGQCSDLFIGTCEPTLEGVQATSAFTQTAGILGLGAASVAVGVMLWAVAKGVGVYGG